MRSLLIIPIILFVVCFLTPIVSAQEFFVFPSEGQSQEQMERDKVECQIWARQQTGFDPMQAPTASTPPPASEARQGGALRGGAAGAAVGAIGSGILGGSVGRGAALGAAGGALFGGMRQSDQNRRDAEAQSQWAQQELAAQSAERERFNRAYRTCLEGKGYTVN